MDTYCAVDSVIRLAVAGGGTLDVYLQCKEWYQDDLRDAVTKEPRNVVAEFRKHRGALADFHAKHRVGDGHYALHVLCTLNPVEGQSWAGHALHTSDATVGEAYIDTTTLRHWCPTAALSASAAAKLRVLEEPFRNEGAQR
jgi:hypothetical protein